VQVDSNGEIRAVPNQSISALHWNWIQSGRKITILLPQPYKTFWGWLRRFDSEFDSVTQLTFSALMVLKELFPLANCGLKNVDFLEFCVVPQRES
jgi:hypothetical protein